MDNTKILLVEDHPSAREAITRVLSHVGFNVVSASTTIEAIKLARSTEFAVVIVDLRLPDHSGIEAIRAIKELEPKTESIIITAYPSFDSSIEAIREDAYDYLLKPLEFDQLIRSVRHAMEKRRLLLEKEDLLCQLQARCETLDEQLATHRRALELRVQSSSSFVGQSEAIRQVRKSIAEIAPSDLTVLIRGESGTGKDVVAHLIHEMSGRGPGLDMVKVNCPAIPETLLESELFGHEAGAFTGATRRKLGRFELAAHGTLFLNEIGQIPPAVQAKLLEAVEEKAFIRLGSEKTIRIETRVLAATNAPLEKMVTTGEFRLDLFYRLTEYSIYLPPLRDRAEDIPLIARHFLRKYGPMSGHKNLSVSSDTMSLLVEHGWPGNVRELETVIRRYVLTGREEIIEKSLAEFQKESPRLRGDDTLVTAEAHAIVSALIRAGGNQRRAAESLGISYSSLRRRIAKQGLQQWVHIVQENGLQYN